MDKLFFLAGCLFSFLGVAAGAFGAHALKSRIAPDLLTVFEVGVRYQMYHALSLLALAWASTKWPNSFVTSSGFLFMSGIVLFSGSLYILSLTGVRAWGAVTPVGGLLFLLGWVFLALGILKG